MSATSNITDIQNAAAAQQNASDTAKASKNTLLDKNAFLSLLTEQLKNQDPTQPMDNTAFVAQLAQFSSLEQMNNVNDNLTKLITAQDTSLQTTAASMVGKTAVYQTDEVALVKGTPAPISATLAQAAANATMVVEDADGTKIATQQLGALPSGLNHLSWNGKDDKGNDVESGTYTIVLTASDLNGKPIALTQNGSARITGITYDNGTPQFQAGGHTLKLSEISELNE